MRVTVTGRDATGQKVEVIAGVGLTPSASPHVMYGLVDRKMRGALTDSAFRICDDRQLAELVETEILLHWPSCGGYFIEVGRGDGDQYVQVFEA